MTAQDRIDELGLAWDRILARFALGRAEVSYTLSLVKRPKDTVLPEVQEWTLSYKPKGNPGREKSSGPDDGVHKESE